MKKIILAIMVCAFLFVAVGADAQTYKPMTSYVVAANMSGTSKFTATTDDFAGAWMTVSSGDSIRYYPRGTSGVSPYGGLIDQGDWYWISSRTEYDAAQFCTISTGSGSSVFVTTYQK
jgi:hypothetical protein